MRRDAYIHVEHPISRDATRYMERMTRNKCTKDTFQVVVPTDVNEIIHETIGLPKSQLESQLGALGVYRIAK